MANYDVLDGLQQAVIEEEQKKQEEQKAMQAGKEPEGAIQHE